MTKNKYIKNIQFLNCLFFMVFIMELLILLIGVLMLSERKQQKQALKKFEDRGDCWACVYRDINDLDPTVQNFFMLLYDKIKEYNKKFNKNFVIFETRRNVNRQKRLIKGGVSWVRHPETAPHVEGRAFDIVEQENGVYKWNAENLKNLRHWINRNFKYSDFLRSEIKNDYPHYEFLRSVFYRLKDNNQIFRG